MRRAAVFAGAVIRALLFGLALVAMPLHAQLVMVSGGRGVSAPPGGGGDCDSMLCMLAASMTPGQELDVEAALNFTFAHILPNEVINSDSPISEYTDNLVWDAENHMAHLMGCARGDTGNPDAYECGNGADSDSGYSYYREIQNDWVRDTTHPVQANPHAYNNATIVPPGSMSSTLVDGTFLYWETRACESDTTGNPAVNCQINVRPGPPGTSWGATIARASSGTGADQDLASEGAFIYFPPRDELIFVDGGDDSNRPAGGATFYPKLLIRPFSTGTWNGTVITSTAADMIGYLETFAKYSPQHQLIFFGGGAATAGGVGSNTLWTYNAAGTLEHQENSPSGLGLGTRGSSGKQVIDPCTGDLLVFDNTPKDIWRFDPTNTSDGTWTNEDTHTLSTTGTDELKAVFGSIPEYDVILIVSFEGGGEVHLYKPETC